MSSVEHLREFVNERLTAAVEEIFGVLRKTIVEYEEEICRQRKLLDIVWKPEINLQRIELPKQHVCPEEEVLQQLCIQQRNPSLHPEPPQIKAEQEELCISQEGEQLVLKQETETFMSTPTYEESDHSEYQTLNLSFDGTAVKEKPPSYLLVKSPVASELNNDHQLVSYSSHVAEGCNQKGGKYGKPKSNVCNSTVSKIPSNTNTSKKTFKCDTCGKSYKFKSQYSIHQRLHTGEKPYSCNTCGKRFSLRSALGGHERIHTGEKPYPCKMCGKDFRFQSGLFIHMKTHTGEKPYLCNTCGKGFCHASALSTHVRVHTGEKPYVCNTCGKGFSQRAALNAHERIHTGEKPYPCKMCGKDFRFQSGLFIHMKTHTGEQPYLCRTCGKTFFQMSDLRKHIRIHADGSLHTCETWEGFQT